MRSFFLYRQADTVDQIPTSDSSVQQLTHRDIVFAYHSESQELLLEEGTKASGGHATWAAVKALGAAMWLRSAESLVRTTGLKMPSCVADRQDGLTEPLNGNRWPDGVRQAGS